MRKSARKYHVTSLFTLLRTRFLSDFSFGFEGSNLGRSIWISAYLWFFFFFFKSSYTASNGANFPLYSRKIVHFDAQRSCFCLYFLGIFVFQDRFHEIIRSWRSTKLFLPLLPRSFSQNNLFSRNNSIILTHQRSCFWLYFHGKFIFQDIFHDVNQSVMSFGSVNTLDFTKFWFEFGLKPYSLCSYFSSAEKSDNFWVCSFVYIFNDRSNFSTNHQIFSKSTLVVHIMKKFKLHGVGVCTVNIHYR